MRDAKHNVIYDGDTNIWNFVLDGWSMRKND